MNITSGELAAVLGAELHGDKTVKLSNIKPLESAKATDISFLTAPRERDKWGALLELAKQSKAGALLVPEFQSEIDNIQIVTPDPMKAIIMLASKFYQAPRDFQGVDERAIVHPSAEIGQNVSIGPGAVIGANSKIGDNTVIHPNVVLYPNVSIGKACLVHAGAVLREFVTLGDDCLIQPNAVVGSDGFGYVPDPQLGHRRIPHIGTVELSDGVDIGANSAIDRGTLGKTVLGRSVKVDNLVQIGHNVKIGEKSLVCGHVGIAGSASIGKNVVIGGKSGVGDHSVLEDGLRVAGNSGVQGHYAGNQDVAGERAFPAKDWLRSVMAFRKLPELFKRVRVIEKHLESTKD